MRMHVYMYVCICACIYDLCMRGHVIPGSVIYLVLLNYVYTYIPYIGERRAIDRGRALATADADRRLRHRRVYEQIGPYTGQETRAYRYVIVYVCV